MKWKRRKIDTTTEKTIITGMIISDRFLREVKSILRTDLFESPFTRVVSSWCNDYYERYGKAPKKTITAIYESKSRDGSLDEDTSDAIYYFLEDLSERYSFEEKFNDDYVLDIAEDYFKSRSMVLLVDGVTSSVMEGDVAGAESLIGGFKRIERPSSKGIDLLNDGDAIASSFDTDRNVLFSMPGALGRKLQPFRRNDLISVVGPAKRGKTWWLQEIGIQALRAQLKVVFVSLEMTQDQMVQRIYRNILAEPKVKGIIRIPVFDCLLNQTNECDLSQRTCDFGVWDKEANKRMPFKDKRVRDYVPCTKCRNNRRVFKQAVWWKELRKEGLDRMNALKKGKLLSKQVRSGNFRLVCFPAYSVSVKDIEVYLNNLEYYDNYIADVVLVDSADIMAPENPGMEYRHQIDHTWKRLRALAQDRFCMVGTPSHSNKKTLETGRVKAVDVVEDARKLNHVGKMFALNQNAQQKNDGVMNINMLVERDDYFDVREEVVVLQSLDLGRPYLDSF